VALAKSEPVGSRRRQEELNDLEDFLWPFIEDDPEFREAIKKLENEGKTWDPRNPKMAGSWNAAYHRGRMRIMMKVMKKNDMLTTGTI